jgi:uncharacterized membrane protein
MEEEKLKSLKTLTMVIYALQAAGFITGGLGFIVAVVVNYIKNEEVAGTPYESHFRWQIRTFWFGLLFGVIGAVTTLILVGFVILFANTIWVIYRIAKGWLNLNDNKPVPATLV